MFPPLGGPDGLFPIGTREILSRPCPDPCWQRSTVAAVTGLLDSEKAKPDEER